MTNEFAKTHTLDEVVEQVVVGGDLSKLTPRDRLNYYHAICKSVGLNPLTRPLEYLYLSGKLVLYARKDATDQLRKKHHVSILPEVKTEVVDGIYVVTVFARDASGREDNEVGAVPIATLKGEALANGIMKAHTKAKRRVTLSICGLGMLDETEIGSIPDAHVARIDHETGEVLDATPPPRPTSRARAADEAGSLTDDAPAEVVRAVADALSPPLDETLERSLRLEQCRGASAKLNLNLPKLAFERFKIGNLREANLDQLTVLLEHLRGLAPAAP